jgi:hypothetical protein
VLPVQGPHLRRASAVALTAAAALTGCGGGASSSSHPSGERIGGTPLQQARCRDWGRAPEAQREAAVSALKVVVGGRTPAGPAQTLTRDEAFRLFDRTCRAPVAQGFLLYELYIRAAGFHSFSKPPV